MTTKRDTYPTPPKLNRSYCTYYAFSDKYKKRIIFKWKVEDRLHALQCLRNMKQTTGWYVVESRDGVKISNERINI